MKCNVGKTDKIIRIILGLVIIALGFIYETWWGLVGLIPLITGLVNWCPIYHACKISTADKEKDKDTE